MESVKKLYNNIKYSSLIFCMILIAATSLCIYTTNNLDYDENDNKFFNKTTNTIISSLIGLLTDEEINVCKSIWVRFKTKILFLKIINDNISFGFV